MHSSRMRTGRALTVSGGGGGTCLVPGDGGVPAWSGGWGVYLPGLGGYLPGPGGEGGVPAWSWGGVYLPGPGGCTCLVKGGCTCLVPGGVPGQVLPPPPREQNE